MKIFFCSYLLEEKYRMMQKSTVWHPWNSSANWSSQSSNNLLGIPLKLHWILKWINLIFKVGCSVKHQLSTTISLISLVFSISKFHLIRCLKKTVLKVFEWTSVVVTCLSCTWCHFSIFMQLWAWKPLFFPMLT